MVSYLKTADDMNKIFSLSAMFWNWVTKAWKEDTQETNEIKISTIIG